MKFTNKHIIVTIILVIILVSIAIKVWGLFD